MSETHIAPAPNPDVRPLTHKQQVFINAYLGEARGNATEAARIAGYKQPVVQGYENLRKPHIAALVREPVEAMGITVEKVLNELADIGFSPWRDFLIIKRNMKGEEVEVRMDLTNKVRSLELLGKHLGMFTERVEVDVRQVEVRLNGMDIESFGQVIEAESREVDAGE